MAHTVGIVDNSIIQRVSTLKAVPPSQWVVLWPFFVLEAALIAAAFDPASLWEARYYEENQRTIDFAHLVAIPLTVFAQGFLGLLTVWNMGIKARIRYSPCDPSTATHAFVETKPHRGESAITPLVTHPKTGKTYFTFQQVDWSFDAAQQRFVKPVYPITMRFSQYAACASEPPLNAAHEAEAAKQKYGGNVIDIRIPEFLELLSDHMLAPFFIFQMFCVTLWLLDDYWMVALFNGGMMFVLECTVVMQRMRSIKTMRDMGAVPVCSVKVWRSGQWRDMLSSELLPLDVIQVNPDAPAPADLVLVCGTCAVNEAMLTGESTPQMKNEVDTDGSAASTKLELDDHARYMVFGGTQVLSSTPGDSPKVAGSPCAVAVVVQTGFETKQGNLIRTIVHSQSRVSQNSGEALGFIALLLVFACAASYYVLVRGLADPTKSRWKLFLTCTQIITNVVPPELPMQLALAVNSSLVALMKLRVFCTEPFRIPFAGKLDTCCFDKTGTLTTDEMLFAGVDPLTAASTSSSGVSTLLRSGITGNVELVLASCHSLVRLPDGKAAGDAMEKAAVDALGWTCSSPDSMEKKSTGAGSIAKPGAGKRDRIDILKRYPFDAAIRRMSCLVSARGGQRFLVAKGSPESIAKICSSKPANVSAAADRYAEQGLRVIALATRFVDASVNLHELSRESAESGMQFAGFAVFECPLKADSAETIRMLSRGLHRCVMITGDSIPTAGAVATQVGMADHTNAVVAMNDPSSPRGVVWTPYIIGGSDFEGGQKNTTSGVPKGKSAFVNAEVLSEETMAEVIAQFSQNVTVWARCAPHQKEAIIATMKAKGSNVLMAGDGTNDVGALKQSHVGIAVLNSALIQATQEAAEKAKTDPNPPKPKTITATGDFVNPMPPPLREGAGFMETLKHQMAVAKHRAEEIQKKKLAAADAQRKQASAMHQASTAAKLNLDSTDAAGAMSSLFNDEMDDPSNAPMIKLGDASIAAPFTCKSKKMTAVCDIVRLGRCTLVTTLQMYKILALNCLISAYTIAVLHTDGVKFGQSQMILSGLTIAVCFLLLNRSKPLEELAAARPINRVFHPYTLVSIAGQFAVHLYSLVASVELVHQENPDAMAAQRGEEEEDFQPTLLNSVLFLSTTMMSITTFAVNYKGRPFMTSLRENRAMALCLLGLAAVVVVCALEVVPEFNEEFELVKFPHDDMRNAFLQLLAIDVGGAYAAEFFAHLLLARLP